MKTLISKGRKDHRFITTENLFFNRKTQTNTEKLSAFLWELAGRGAAIFDNPQTLKTYYDEFSNNVLHLAEIGNDQQSAKTLIDHAPELMHEKNQFGHYPAHFAAAQDSALQKYPAEILKCKTPLQQNMLHIAAAHSATDNINHLLALGDFLNELTAFDCNPLHCALVKKTVKKASLCKNMRRVDTTKLLLSHMDERQRKQQLQQKNAFDLSPLDYIELYLQPAERALLADFL